MLLTNNYFSTQGTNIDSVETSEITVLIGEQVCNFTFRPQLNSTHMVMFSTKCITHTQLPLNDNALFSTGILV